MTIDVEILKEIRSQTSMPVSSIKKALEEAGGDKNKALEILLTSGEAAAMKKSSRETSEGSVFAYIHSNKKIGVLIKILCETDFVARNPDFQSLGSQIAMHVAAMKPASVEECLDQPSIHNPEKTIRQVIQEAIARIGENIKLEDIVCYTV